MRTIWMVSVVALTVICPGTFPAYGQTASTPKVCALMPTADLEALFSAKASAGRGLDTATVANCGMDLPDRLHSALLTSRPAGPASLTVASRLATMKPLFDKSGAQVKDFGDVGCFTDRVQIGPTKVPTATCFLEKGGYLSLQLLSTDPKHLGFETVKQLLEKAAAQRK
jgi:hypothetical protein